MTVPSLNPIDGEGAIRLSRLERLARRVQQRDHFVAAGASVLEGSHGVDVFIPPPQPTQPTSGGDDTLVIARVDQDTAVLAVDENGVQVFNVYDATAVRFLPDAALLATPSDITKVWLYSTNAQILEATHYYPAKQVGVITLFRPGVVPSVGSPSLTPVPGSIATIKITSGGSGYASPPAVTMSGGEGHGFVGRAEITSLPDGSGGVTGVITSEAGSGFTSVPTAVFTSIPGDPGQGAAALVSINGIAETRPLLILAQADTEILKVDGPPSSFGLCSAFLISFHLGNPSGVNSQAAWLVSADQTFYQVGDYVGGIPNGNLPIGQDVRPLYIGLPKGTAGSSGGGGGGGGDSLNIARVDQDGEVVVVDENGNPARGFYDATAVRFLPDPALISTPIDLSKVWLYSSNAEVLDKTHYYPAKQFGTITLFWGDGTSQNGGVAAIVITKEGSGYTSVPNVSISGGGGSGAHAVAFLTGDQVTGIVLDSGGSGYTSPPTVTIDPPGTPGGLQATAVAVLNGTADTRPLLVLSQQNTSVIKIGPGGLNSGFGVYDAVLYAVHLKNPQAVPSENVWLAPVDSTQFEPDDWVSGIPNGYYAIPGDTRPLYICLPQGKRTLVTAGCAITVASIDQPQINTREFNVSWRGLQILGYGGGQGAAVGCNILSQCPFDVANVTDGTVWLGVDTIVPDPCDFVTIVSQGNCQTLAKVTLRTGGATGGPLFTFLDQFCLAHTLKICFKDGLYRGYVLDGQSFE